MLVLHKAFVLFSLFFGGNIVRKLKVFFCIFGVYLININFTDQSSFYKLKL